MEIKIYKENDYVKFSVDGSDSEFVTFQSLVSFAKRLIQEKISPENCDVQCDDSQLELYKVTFKDMIERVLTDTELLQLLDEKTAADN